MIATRSIDREASQIPARMNLRGGSVRAVRAVGWLAAALAVLGALLPSLASAGLGEAAATERLTTGLLCMAIVQLAMSHVIPRSGSAPASWLLSIGTVAYAGGVCLIPEAAWLAAIGTLAILAGIALVWLGPVTNWNGYERRILTGLFFAGVALDGAFALATLIPESAWALHFGPPLELRFRLLALARVAGMTLPALVLLYQQAASRRVLSAPSISWVCLALHAGAVLMPGVLVLAAVVNPSWKYLLPVPALLVFFGTCGAARLARRRGLGLERFGWVLMACSMAAGLVMGLYAFDGPLPSPAWIGAYGDAVRSVLRQTHGLAIAAGLLVIFFARDQRLWFRGGQ